METLALKVFLPQDVLIDKEVRIQLRENTRSAKTKYKAGG